MLFIHTFNAMFWNIWIAYQTSAFGNVINWNTDQTQHQTHAETASDNWEKNTLLNLFPHLLLSQL